MGIAHGSGAGRHAGAAHFDQEIAGIGLLRQRDLLPVQPRLAHIHRHCALAGIAADQKPAHGGKLDPHQAALVQQQARDTARGVVAAFRFRSVGIVEQHAGIGLGAAGADHHHRVAADAEMPVGDLAQLFGGKGNSAVACVKHDEVIAQSVHFQEGGHGMGL